MKNYFILLFSLVISPLILQGQADIPQHEVSNGVDFPISNMEHNYLLDQFGTRYTYKELRTTTSLLRNNGTTTQCGAFQLEYIDLTPAEEQTICEVFNYLSSIITIGPGGTSPHIRVVKKPILRPDNTPDLATGAIGTTLFEPDCGIVNNFIYNVMNSGAAANYPPCTASGVLCINELVPMYTMNETPANGEIDLYSVALHEALHVLGFSSQIGANGDPAQGFYSMWDAFLYSDNDDEFLITPDAPSPGCCDNARFNPNLDFNTLFTANCDMNIFFNNGQNLAEVFGEGYDASAGEIGNLLSHLNLCGSGGGQYVMHAAIAPFPAPPRRTLRPEEVDILLALGYTPAGATTEPCRVIAADDFFTTNSSFIFLTYNQIVANDDFPDDDGTVTIDEIEIHFTGCGNVEDFDLNFTPGNEGIQISRINPCANLELCYTIRGCDVNGVGGQCDDGVIRISRACPPCVEQLPPCDIPDVCNGGNLVCYGTFEELSPTWGGGISQITGQSPCGVEMSPDILYEVDGNNNSLQLNPNEAVAIPLITPIQPGCTANLSFNAAALGQNGPIDINAFFTNGSACVINGTPGCPSNTNDPFQCVGSQSIPLGGPRSTTVNRGEPNFPDTEVAACVNRLFLVDDITWTPVSLPQFTNNTGAPLDHIYFTRGGGALFLSIDNIVVTANCANQVEVTLEQIPEVCIGQVTEFDVEVCLIGTNMTAVDITLTLDLAQIIGVGIEAGSPFADGTHVIVGAVPSTTCYTTTVDLEVGFAVTPGTMIPMSLEVEAPNACLSDQSILDALPEAVECEPVCVLSAVPTITNVCGSVLGSVSLSVLGGSGNYNFTWTGPASGSSTNPVISNLPVGKYTIIITDQNNASCGTVVEIEIGVDDGCTGCQGETVPVNFTIDDSYCLGSSMASPGMTRYYLDLHIPNWGGGTQNVDFVLCSDEVTLQGATIESMVTENLGFALDIFIIFEVPTASQDDPNICFNVPICINGEEACAEFCLTELPECAEKECDLDIVPDIKLTPIQDGKGCEGAAGPDYLYTVEGNINIVGTGLQDVTIIYNQQNGNPIPSGYFQFSNLSNTGGTVSSPGFAFCWDGSYGLEYFCFDVIVIDNLHEQICTTTFCLPVSDLVGEMKGGGEGGKGGEDGKFRNMQASSTTPAVDWFPNPANEYLNVYNRSEEQVFVSLSTLQGKGIRTLEIGEFGQEVIHVQYLPNGIYLLDIRNAKGQVIGREKIVVIH